MRHEGPFPYGDTGYWHYASVKHGKGGYPIGYCTTGCTHATKEEAHEHYRQYVLDNLREESIVNMLLKCEVDGCEAWTDKGLAEPDGYSHRMMCDAHRNRATYEDEFYSEGSGIRESWVS